METLNKYLWICFLTFGGCTGITQLAKDNSQKPLLIQKIKRSIAPGDVRYERHPSLRGIASDSKINLECRGKMVPFYDDGTSISFFLRESYFSDLTPYTCNIIVGENDKAWTIPWIDVDVASKEFKTEVLSVDSSKVTLSDADSERVKAEQEMLNGLYAATRNYPIYEGHFQFPMKKPISSRYGTKRTFNKIKQGQHLGTDFKAWVGAPVKAANTGVVVLARDLFYTGLTVILDHGIGLFTIYGHLDKIYLREGDKVLKGDSVGLSGKSGRVTGPHLHWGVKANGEWVDGEQLVIQPIFNNDLAQNGFQNSATPR